MNKGHRQGRGRAEKPQRGENRFLREVAGRTQLQRAIKLSRGERTIHNWDREDRLAKEWLAEENPGELAKLLFGTKTALKRLAPEFKKIEQGMEEAFWRSRYAKP